MLRVGLSATLRRGVARENTAAAMGSGSLPVFATPAMVLLIEQTCCKALEGALEAGSATVGTHLDIEHLRPTVIGGAVTCVCELIGIEGGRLTFSARCEDAFGPVGRGSHCRHIVDEEGFMLRARERTGE